jgi:O-antigen/teichoic acid export membrane protein
MSIRSRIISGTKWTTLSAILSAIIAIAKISILTRFLDKKDFGLMAIVMFVIGFMELFNDLGTSTAILHKKEISRNEYSSIYWLNIITSIIIYFSIVAVSPLISSFYKYPEIASILPLLATTIIISSIGRQFRIVETKNLLFKKISIVEISALIISLLTSVYLAMNSYGIYSLVYSTIAQTTFASIAFMITGLKKNKPILRFRYSETKPFLRIGGFHVGGQVTNYFNRDLDILIIGHYFSAELLGGYNLAKQLVFRPMQIINPILTKVASPALARLQHDKNLLKESYLKLLTIVSSTNIVAYCILIIFASPIVSLLYGDHMLPIVTQVRILSIYMIFRAIGNPIGSLVVATGRTDLELIKNIVTLFTIPLSVFIGVSFGITGATVALAFSSILLFLPTWKLLVNKMIGASLQEYLSAIFIPKPSMIIKMFRNN